LIVVILYCGGFAPLLLLVGLFSGPQVFVAGLVHLLTALLCYYFRLKIMSKSRWARYVTISFSVLAFIIVCIAAYQMVQSPDSRPAVVFPLLAAVVFALISVSLMRNDAAKWFDKIP
jgi:hypothetical protein